jgi:hypothetical protein
MFHSPQDPCCNRTGEAFSSELLKLSRIRRIKYSINSTNINLIVSRNTKFCFRHVHTLPRQQGKQGTSPKELPYRVSGNSIRLNREVPIFEQHALPTTISLIHKWPEIPKFHDVFSQHASTSTEAPQPRCR